VCWEEAGAGDARGKWLPEKLAEGHYIVFCCCGVVFEGNRDGEEEVW
jgi:hypothetical protein